MKPRFSPCALALLALSTSCSAIYAFNASEEGLACGPDDANGTPRCKDGFVCVRADDGIDRCILGASKVEGDPCVDSGECQDGAVCADVFADRCNGEVIQPEHVLDCALRDSDDGGLRCRRPCKDDFTCGADFRCFDIEGLPPFCQRGTCAGDNDCVADLQSGLCVEEGLNGGKSGLCRTECSPLACNGGGGVCACVVGENCGSPPDDGFISARAVCLPEGIIQAGFTCDAANFCESGATCVAFTDFSACAQWCRVGGGGPPACNVGDCDGVDASDPTVGICDASN